VIDFDALTHVAVIFAGCALAGGIWAIATRWADRRIRRHYHEAGVGGAREIECTACGESALPGEDWWDGNHPFVCSVRKPRG
jgi:hypothetical protein